MSFNYEKKKFLVKTNKYNANTEKDKITLISIGKTNLLKNINKEKRYFKLIYERNKNIKKLTKLFGEYFIKNNNKLRIILNNKEKKIKEYLIINGIIKIKKEMILKL